MNIYMTDENNRLTEEQRQLVESILIYTAEQEEVDPNSELSVTFVSNDEIQEINRGVGKIRRQTSFPSRWKNSEKMKSILDYWKMNQSSSVI